jgi:hypothetical protein
MFVVFVASTICHAPISVLIYLVFRIKMNRNLALFPTIQKLDRNFTVSGFAAHLKPNVFDGTNYKRWVRKLELWLVSMSIWFHIVRKLKGLLLSRALSRRTMRTGRLITCSEGL